MIGHIRAAGRSTPALARASTRDPGSRLGAFAAGAGYRDELVQNPPPLDPPTRSIAVLNRPNQLRMSETLECVLVRSDNEAVVVNLDIEPVEKPETVHWVDPIHKAPEVGS